MTGTQKTQSWHSNPVEVVMKLVNGNINGLGEEEAQRRLTEYGFNQLPQKPPPSWWQILLRQFRSPLIYVLALATL
ncbi:MAG: cation-transporting P-type ATPase, partial [Mastigocoleus sp. MO_167.B18]|nr:cation-transporting P-type ATPase [Mastigocoleus sp. MO_167.B18]